MYWGNKTAPLWDNPLPPGPGDFWIVRTDALGVKLWERSYGGSRDDTLEAIVSATDGGFLLAGFSSSGPFGPYVDGNKYATNHGLYTVENPYDGWVVRIDIAGNRIWDATYGGTQDDQLWDALATSDGGFLLVGWSKSGADGNKTAPNRGGMDAWLVKIDSQGNLLWENAYSGGSVSTNHGWISHSGLLALPEGGQKRWEAAYGPVGSDWSTRGYTAPGYSVALLAAPSGGYLLASTDKRPYYWFVRIDKERNKVWDASYGGDPDLSQCIGGNLFTTVSFCSNEATDAP